MPSSGVVLEVASGTGQHLVHFARALPTLQLQPSDPDPEARASIAAWIDHTGVPNALPPLDLDVLSEVWPVKNADAMVCINMIHISPWAATMALIAGAARLLPTGNPVFLYGPFRRSDRQTAPSNEEFDVQLRERNPKWGLRDLEAVVSLANASGLELSAVTEMPANNLSVVFRTLA